MDGEWEAVSWLPDSSELILSTWRGDYYQISRGGKRGWSLPSISEPERGGATISTAPTGNVLTVWGNSPAKEWIGNPSAVQPNFDRIEGIETAQAQVGLIKDAHDKGYRVTVNLMAISAIQERELEEALTILAATPVCAIYIVDSFGAYYSEQIRDITLMFMKAAEGTGIEIGIHAHNNQMLAYANTLEALIVGANRLDATINGMGRGAGNCPLELLLGFLKNPKFQLRPVLGCIRDHFLPLEKEGIMEWGYKIPYMIDLC